MSRRGHDSPVSASALALLLSREAELEVRLRDAHERAESLVREAEAAAQARQAGLEAELSAAAIAIQRQHADRCAERVAALTRGSARAVARLRTIDATRIAALSEWVAGQILDEAAGTTGDS